MCGVWADSHARDNYHDRLHYPDNAAAGRSAATILLADHHDHHHVVA
jgi:hypothetical protein